MATSQTKADTKEKQPRVPVKLAEKLKGQLTNGALRGQLNAEDLTMLGDFISKLKAVVA